MHAQDTNTQAYRYTHSPDSMYNMVFRMEIAFEVGARALVRVFCAVDCEMMATHAPARNICLDVAWWLCGFFVGEQESSVHI